MTHKLTRTTLLTPRMAGLLDRIQRAGRPPFRSLPVVDARRAYQASAEILDLPRAPLPRVEQLQIPATDGYLMAARLYAPDTVAGLPVLLYFHGGGFTIGDLETHDSLCRQLALRSGAAVIALDYRLAPEFAFPVAVEDCWAAMSWLANHAGDLALDPARLAVGGDSAGGTLAAVAALHARDIGLPLAAQVLITPGTTAHADTASHHLFANGFLLEAADIAWFFDHYIPRGHRSNWRFAPLEASDVDHVAPACVVLAECDPLVDEGIAYADKLRAAGVPVELELYRGLTHDFIKMGRAIPEALEAQQAIGDFLRGTLAA